MERWQRWAEARLARPDPAEQRQRAQLSLLRGLATATWGDRHQDPQLSRRGRAALTRTLAELER